MLKASLAMFMIGGTAAWGQAKVDRAAAYYHYTLAHMYAEKAAASGGRNREYADKAVANFKAAIQADPRTPVTSQELSGVYATRLSGPRGMGMPQRLPMGPGDFGPPAPRKPAP